MVAEFVSGSVSWENPFGPIPSPNFLGIRHEPHLFMGTRALVYAAVWLIPIGAGVWSN